MGPNHNPYQTPQRMPSAVPPSNQDPHSTSSPHTHTSTLSNGSSTSHAPTSPTASSGELSPLKANANAFTPRREVIKSQSGQEVDLERWRKPSATAVASPVTPSSPARRTVRVRLETEEARKKRLAGAEGEKAKKEAEKDAKEVRHKAEREEEGKRKGAEVSANLWAPASLVKKGQPSHIDLESPEVVDRKVRLLLNRLSMERFDSISDQIIAWVNRSEKEKDGRTLIQVIRLVFEKATNEATSCEMYARLCRKMVEQISPNVHDDGIKNANGKPIAGGQLFRKYLLNRCQEDFERGWVAREATASAAATKVSEDQAVKVLAVQNKNEERPLYSDYAAQKARRQGLGLIRFIGELFKVQMLTKRIMHECMKKLLGNVEHPEEIESSCTLMTTVGQVLDTQKARAHMDVYFSRMEELSRSPDVNSRMRSMLQVHHSWQILQKLTTDLP